MGLPHCIDHDQVVTKYKIDLSPQSKQSKRNNLYLNRRTIVAVPSKIIDTGRFIEARHPLCRRRTMSIAGIEGKVAINLSECA